MCVCVCMRARARVLCVYDISSAARQTSTTIWNLFFKSWCNQIPSPFFFSSLYSFQLLRGKKSLITKYSFILSAARNK